jgi:hypothetical protein
VFLLIGKTGIKKPEIEEHLEVADRSVSQERIL